MNMVDVLLGVGLIVVFISGVSCILLMQRLKDLHQEKSHIIPLWTYFFSVMVVLVHVAAMGVLGILLFSPHVLEGVV